MSPHERRTRSVRGILRPRCAQHVPEAVRNGVVVWPLGENSIHDSKSRCVDLSPRVVGYPSAHHFQYCHSEGPHVATRRVCIVEVRAERLGSLPSERFGGDRPGEDAFLRPDGLGETSICDKGATVWCDYDVFLQRRLDMCNTLTANKRDSHRRSSREQRLLSGDRQRRWRLAITVRERSARAQ